MKNTEYDLRELINRAKGSRNMTEFAAACGVGQATLYKIAQGNIRRPIAPNTLNAILENADAGCGITREDFDLAQQRAIAAFSPTKAFIERGRLRDAYADKLSYFIPGKITSKGLVVQSYMSTIGQKPGDPYDFKFNVYSDQYTELWFFYVMCVYAEDTVKMSASNVFERIFSRFSRLWLFDPAPLDETYYWMHFVIVIDGDTESKEKLIATLREGVGSMQKRANICLVLADTELNLLEEITPPGVERVLTICSE